MRKRTWGGKRAGAGHPETGVEQDKVVTIRIGADLYAKAKKRAGEQGFSAWVRKLIEEAL
jgi:hypothetical protein